VAMVATAATVGVAAAAAAAAAAVERRVGVMLVDVWIKPEDTM